VQASISTNCFGDRAESFMKEYPDYTD